MEDNKKPALRFNQLAKMLEDRNARQLALDTLIDGLTSERSYYDVLRKSTVTEPDFKTRAQCAEILLAYTDGKPVERKEIIQHNADSMEALAARVKKSPELLSVMRKMVADAEKPAFESGKKDSAQVVGNIS